MISTDQVKEGSQAYIVLHTQRDDNGYIPSLVTAYENGHSPMKGKGKDSTPWCWGKTFEEATDICEAQNRRIFGITEEQAMLIKCTTMGGYA